MSNAPLETLYRPPHAILATDTPGPCPAWRPGPAQPAAQSSPAGGPFLSVPAARIFPNANANRHRQPRLPVSGHPHLAPPYASAAPWAGCMQLQSGEPTVTRSTGAARR
eukprot:EG_transcript_30466